VVDELAILDTWEVVVIALTSALDEVSAEKVAGGLLDGTNAVLKSINTQTPHKPKNTVTMIQLRLDLGIRRIVNTPCYNK
jgi:hypothetical protein